MKLIFNSEENIFNYILDVLGYDFSDDSIKYFIRSVLCDNSLEIDSSQVILQHIKDNYAHNLSNESALTVAYKINQCILTYIREYFPDFSIYENKYVFLPSEIKFKGKELHIELGRRR